MALASQIQTFSASWSSPASQATGIYALKIGVFAPGLASLYAWSNGAAAFSVQ